MALALLSSGCRQDPADQPRLADGVVLLATVDTRIEHDLRASGGTPPYDFRLRTGTEVWPGVGLSVDGRISGAPREPGRGQIAIIVADAEGRESEGRVGIDVQEDLYGYGSPDCQRPDTLVLQDPSAALVVVSGRFPSSEGEAVLFYSFTLTDTARIRLSASTHANFQLGAEACTLDRANASPSIDGRLEAGTWTFAIYGPSGTEFSFVLSVEEPQAANACPSPLPMPLAFGRQTFVLTSPALFPNEHAGSCGGAQSGELALGFSIDAASDVDFELSSAWGHLVLRAEDCRGPELTCQEGRTLSRSQLAAGRYTLVVESQGSSVVQVAVSRHVPAVRPANDRCSAAEPVDLSSGAAIIEGEFVAAEPDGRDCGEQRPLHYSIELGAREDLHVETNDSVYVALLDANCNALLDCTSGVSLCAGLLGAGRHILRVTPTGSLQRRFEARIFTTPRPTEQPPTNDECSGATHLNAEPGNDQYEVDFAGATRQITSCAVGSEEVYYRLDLPERSDIGIFGAPVQILGEGCAEQPICAQSWNTVEYGLGPGPVWFAIFHDQGDDSLPNFADCFVPGLRQSFWLEIEPSPALPPNIDCESAEVIAVTATLALARISGTTLGAPWRSSSSCAFVDERRPTVVYALALGGTSRWRLTETTESVRANLQLKSVCDATSSLYCSSYLGDQIETPTALISGTYYLHVSTEVPSDFSIVLERLDP